MIYPTYKIALLALKRGITRQGEIIQTRKKIRVSYFWWGIHKWNFKTLAWICFERTEGRTNGRTHARTSRNQYAPHFFKVRGHKKLNRTEKRYMYLQINAATRNVKYVLRIIEAKPNSFATIFMTTVSEIISLLYTFLNIKRIANELATVDTRRKYPAAILKLIEVKSLRIIFIINYWHNTGYIKFPHINQINQNSVSCGHNDIVASVECH